MELIPWGEAIFKKIKGMYAIALFDRRSAQLHLSRDAFGIKPLYIREAEGVVSFASEIKGLAGAVQLDRTGFADLITLGYHLGESSLYAGVTSIKPGFRRVYTLTPDGAGTATRADKPLQHIATKKPSEHSLRECLTKSVSEHMIADVAVASTLSGGLDSSIVTALACAEHVGVTAYTNTLTPGGDAETRHAAVLAEHLGISHRVLFSEVNDLHALVDTITRHLEEPLVNSAIFNSYYLAAHIKADGYKVALVGEGSDELFAGYPWHSLPLTLNDHGSIFDTLWKSRAVVPDLPRYLTAAACNAITERKAEQAEIFRDEMKIDVGSDFNRFLLFDTSHQLVTMQLQRIDRLFMAHGVEARVPFLYDDVIQWAYHSTTEQRLALANDYAGPRRDKACLAEAFEGRMPEQILRRPKFGKDGSANVGATPPMKQWPSVLERVRSDERYAEARDVTSVYVDWPALAGATTNRKEQMFLSMLTMGVANLLDDNGAQRARPVAVV